MLWSVSMAQDAVSRYLYSPGRDVRLSITNNDKGLSELQVSCRDDKKYLPVINIPYIGMLPDFSRQKGQRIEKLLTISSKAKIHYRMITGKRSHCANAYSEYLMALTSGNDIALRMRVRLYDDGVALRYEWDHLPKGTRLQRECTAYSPVGARSVHWIQSLNNYYEKFYDCKNRVMTGMYAYPALFESDGAFALITESGMERDHSASYLSVGSDSVYRVESNVDNSSDHTPWRVLMAGKLNKIVESTLVTDLAPECAINDTDWIKPGLCSWVYWANNRGSKNFRVVQSYIQMAADLGLPYVLIDWEWDRMMNGGNVDSCIAMANRLGVGVWLWYDSASSGSHGNPRLRFGDSLAIDREFKMLSSKGVKGVKVDFFGGDNRRIMNYYVDILECAARHHLMVDFHGCTLPRGWQRTYPNLMTMEGVLGAEWYNNGPDLGTRAASHNATLPFTRNVVGSMDYTPCTFSDSQNPHFTTHAHELALTVLFESGLQCLADRPESYYSQPQEVQFDFLSNLPASWDDTRLVSGYPGKYVVMARRHGKRWYVAGINGTSEPKDLDLVALSKIVGKVRRVTLYADTHKADREWNIQQMKRPAQSVWCRGRGGFVMVCE